MHGKQGFNRIQDLRCSMRHSAITAIIILIFSLILPFNSEANPFSSLIKSLPKSTRKAVKPLKKVKKKDLLDLLPVDQPIPKGADEMGDVYHIRKVVLNPIQAQKY